MKKIPIVTFTFDDGTMDHYTHAAPVLEKFGYRGIFCVTTGYVDGTAKWEYPCMHEWMVKELVQRGHEIASHTATHSNMRTLWFSKGKEACLEELKSSREALYKMTGIYVKWFCYPYNRGCPMVSRLARKVGMEPFCPIVRPNMGGYKWPSYDQDKIKDIENIIFSGKSHIDLMFHGCLPNEGWNSFGTDKDFEFIVKHIKKLEQEGRIHVAKYSQGHETKHRMFFKLYDLVACAVWPLAYRLLCMIKRRPLVIE